MYLVRSLRTFIGTNAERTAAGLESFLPGDEYIETDTSLVYIHNGMAWLLNSSAGSPGGSDTQIQFNDGGTFEGDANLTWNNTSKILNVTKSSASTAVPFLELENTGGVNGAIYLYTTSQDATIGFAGGSFNILASSSTWNATGSVMQFTAYDSLSFYAFGIPGLTFNDTSDYEAVFNEGGLDFNFRIESEDYPYAFYIDGDTGIVSIGDATAGTIAQFSPAGIVFNNGENDINFRIAGDGITNAYFYDAGLNRHGFGTGTPGAFVYIDNTETSGTPETGLTVDNTYAPTSNPGTVFPTSLSLLADYDSSTTPSGGFVLAQFLRVRNVANGVMSARCLDIQFQNLGTGTTPFFTGVNVRTPTNSGGGAITTAYGLKVENQNIAGTNYAIYTDAGAVRFGDGVTIDTTTAALTVPRMTTTQQNALTAVNGMVIYNTSTNKLRVRAGGAWVDLH